MTGESNKHDIFPFLMFQCFTLSILFLIGEVMDTLTKITFLLFKFINKKHLCKGINYIRKLLKKPNTLRNTLFLCKNYNNCKWPGFQLKFELGVFTLKKFDQHLTLFELLLCRLTQKHTQNKQQWVHYDIQVPNHKYKNQG